MYKVFISDGNEPIEVCLHSITEVTDLINLLNPALNNDIHVTVLYRKEQEVKR